MFGNSQGGHRIAANRSFEGGAGNRARRPGTGISGRLQGDAARTGVNDHEPMTVRPDLIEF